jgi:hypothetical protein
LTNELKDFSLSCELLLVDEWMLSTNMVILTYTQNCSLSSIYSSDMEFLVELFM